MARNVSSASASRWRRSATSASVPSFGTPPSRTDPEAREDAAGVGHVADHLARRQGQDLEQGRRGDELVLHRELRLLIDVDHLEIVDAVQVLLAQPGDVAYRAPRFLGMSGD